MSRGLYVIGLTGNIATGKSTVAAVMRDLGAQVLDADVLAHEVMQPGTATFDQVVAEFGPAMLQPDGAIDRKRLGALVFADSAALGRLEAIVHPAVIAEQERLLNRWQSERPGGIVVIEAIKLIESGIAKRCDALWVVTSGRETQVERLMTQRSLTRHEAELRVDAQALQAEKVALADVVIPNDTNLEELRQRVTAEWERVRQIQALQDGPSRKPEAGGQMVSWRKWIDEHPSLSMWVALSIGMVVIFAVTSQDVPLLWNQRLFMAAACVLLAGLCSWIISWE
jgi:dephospho-CoA kinase